MKIRCQVVVLVIASLVALRADASVCGNGVVEPSEECDPGGQLHCEGNPALPTCVTGADCSSGDNCYFALSCCKFNCQYVGEGALCADGNPCTYDDECNNIGLCTGNTSPDGTVCDDGTFCNGPDQCDSGLCTDHAGDPCVAGGVCNDMCNESVDNCYSPGGTACPADPNDCTDDACDGAGGCAHPFNTAPCDDGVFCNGGDSCNGGACVQHQGDPCASGPPCDNVCNEQLGNCAVETGTLCNDGSICTDGDQCSGGMCTATSLLDCDDSDACTSDSCDALSGCAHLTNVETALCGSCSDGIDNDGDGDLDTEDDGCATLAALQRFALIGLVTSGSPSLDIRKFTHIERSAGTTTDLAMPYPQGPSKAGACGNDVRMRKASYLAGTLAADGNTSFATGTGVINVGTTYETDGGTELLKGRNPPFVGPGLCDDMATVCVIDSQCPSGQACSVRPALNDPANPYVDRTGTDAEFTRCRRALSLAQSLSDSIATLSGTSAGEVKLRKGDPPASLVVGGGQQVVQLDRVVLSLKTQLTITGQPDTVLVLRIADSFGLGRGASIVLAGGILPEHVLYNVEGPGSVRLGHGAVAPGTILAPGRAKVAIAAFAELSGAAIGGRVRTNAYSDVLHIPFTALLQ